MHIVVVAMLLGVRGVLVATCGLMPPHRTASVCVCAWAVGNGASVCVCAWAVGNGDGCILYFMVSWFPDSYVGAPPVYVYVMSGKSCLYKNIYKTSGQ